MTRQQPAWQRWAGRLGWFAAGAVAYALVFGGGEDPPVTTLAEAQPADPAAVVEPARVDLPAEPPAPSVPSSSRMDVPESHADEPEADTLPPEPELDVPSPDEPKLDVPSTTDPTGAAPKFPLPRMPGTRKLRGSATPSPDGRGWILVQTLRVPAKLGHVEAFYRKALTDQGLSVTGGSTPAQPDRAFLRGRSRRAHADVTITSREGRLQSTVRTIWRTFR